MSSLLVVEIVMKTRESFYRKKKAHTILSKLGQGSLIGFLWVEMLCLLASIHSILDPRI